MDTVTHIVLGACIGEAVAGRYLGKKALLLGALAQSIPDFDFVASFWMTTSSDLLAHRGITHSFLFAVVFSLLLAWFSGILDKKKRVSFGRWVLFWALGLFVHIFIDAFNAYGTGWFEPFSHQRISFNTMFVADPLFTIWPAAALIVLLILKRSSPKRKLWTGIGIWVCTIYWALGIVFAVCISYTVKQNFERKGMVVSRFFVTPTPLNNLLWYAVAENDSGYFIGYRSILDKTQDIDFHFVNRNESLLKLSKNTGDIAKLLRFSQGYYTAEYKHDTLVFNDLRFGEILGWAEPHPEFVFHYYLQYPSANKVVVQRGRFARWDKSAITIFLNRIKGI